MGDLGFVWNIGHEGGLCVTNHSPARAMVFLHEHGVMDMPVKFCECLTAESEAEQLIRHGCWPATWKSPHTAITLATMATFHGLELQGQLNVHDYIRFLRRMTDGVEPDSVKVSGFSPDVLSMLTQGRINTGSSTTACANIDKSALVAVTECRQARSRAMESYRYSVQRVHNRI